VGLHALRKFLIVRAIRPPAVDLGLIDPANTDEFDRAVGATVVLADFDGWLIELSNR
jgi:hypothetical protein